MIEPREGVISPLKTMMLLAFIIYLICAAIAPLIWPIESFVK